MNKTISIIGGGNLGTAILNGFVFKKLYQKKDILVSEKKKHRIQFLSENGYNVITDNVQAAKAAEILIIAVKPQQIEDVLNEIKDHVKGKIILSTVTGYTLKSYESIIGDIPVFRIMPNTAIDIAESMTCLSFANATDEQEKLVVDLLEEVGPTMVIDEEQLSSATVLGACGVGFALRFIRSMSQGGIEIGFGSEVSQFIAAQTIKGAAELILRSGNHPEREIDKVTTPQGITISGLNEMEHQGFSSSVIKGLLTSFNKLEAFKKDK
jgi:pyrroline-5-carboxylate reductase